MTNGFDKIDKPFTATLTKKGREPIDVHNVKTITYDVSTRTYVLNAPDGNTLSTVQIDELQSVSLTRPRK